MRGNCLKLQANLIIVYNISTILFRFLDLGIESTRFYLQLNQLHPVLEFTCEVDTNNSRLSLVLVERSDSFF